MASGINNRGQKQKETNGGHPKTIALKILTEINNPNYLRKYHERIKLLSQHRFYGNILFHDAANEIFIQFEKLWEVGGKTNVLQIEVMQTHEKIWDVVDQVDLLKTDRGF